ncbi:AraC family transcriptional regulator [Pandoraea faecigallinarum]|uniref:AraC family transcriptional regulator n=1 Tax=Pandoraea faecigallinarum TaxID=656179 RepID=A0A0H3WMU5_9BURK|nr:helix-turn-helix domain-containing protein [Pandoraea faecigallinarum]AKM29037.1 AraC family transcriptional regulator [Pandoraea faecigallinarum]
MPRLQPVYLLVMPDSLLLDVAAPAEALRMANHQQDEVRFELRYVGTQRSVATSIGLRVSPLDVLPEHVPDDAWLVVTGTVERPLPVQRVGEDEEDEEDNEDDEDGGYSRHSQRSKHDAQAGRHDAEALAIAWLRRVVRPTQQLACICTGALLAARAGLLDSLACTTHHGSCGVLRALAPGARVADNRLYVRDGNVWTSAGVTTGLDLMLTLIADATSPLCAAAVARQMVVYARRAGADPQLSPWLDGRNHLHPAVHRVQDAIAAAPANDWTLAAMADIACTSERHVTRLFREHAGVAPIDYLHRLRIALAREMLGNTRLDLEHIAQRAGFGSSRHLRRVWHKFDALPPSRARTAGV